MLIQPAQRAHTLGLERKFETRSVCTLRPHDRALGKSNFRSNPFMLDIDEWAAMAKACSEHSGCVLKDCLDEPIGVFAKAGF